MHRHFVTSMNFVYRKDKNQLVLLTGDTSGELIVSEIVYSNKTFKLDSIEVIFRRRAHKGQITCILPCSHEDVVLTASHDGSIA